MSTIQSKIWGSNIEIFRTDTVSVNILHIRKGGTCSLHTHRSKHNKFHVISGELKLMVESLLHPIHLYPFDGFVVCPGQAHRFQAMVSSVVVETVYVKLDSSDIDRKEPGYKEECLNSDLWRKLFV